MSLVSSNSKKVFLCSDSKIDVKNKVDIILSPEFYWVRIFDIPVKSVTQARHVLPTLFEDILESVNELSFQVIKLENEKYLCFAYINKRIFEELKNSGISLSLVNSIYFAQTECQEIPQFISGDKGFLYTQDGILVKAPKNILNEAVDINKKCNDIELSSNKVDIKLYNNVLGKKQIYSIVIILFILAGLNIYKLIDYKVENSQIDEKISKFKTTSKLPSSMIQTNSIIKKYEKIALNENKKREIIEYLLEDKRFRPSKLSLERNVITISFINIDKNKVEKYISKKYKILSSKVKGLNLNIKVSL